MGKHCDKLVDLGRRKFLTGASVAAAAVAASATVGARCEGGARRRAGHLSIKPARQCA